MKIFKENKLESLFIILVAEQCWSGTSALLSKQNHKRSSSLFCSTIFIL